MAVVAEVICQLRDAGLPIDEDEINDERAFLAASSLLLAIGVEPVIDPEYTSAAADMVRGLLLERRTHTTTRSRRAL